MPPKLLLICLLLLQLFFLLEAGRQISCAIQRIRKKKVDGQLAQPDSTELNDHWLGFDESRRLVFVSVDVQSKNLDKGAEPTEDTRKWVETVGEPGDIPVQIIDAKLGGAGDVQNVFPLSGKADTAKLKADQTTVYNHIGSGANKHAKLKYAFDYSDEAEQSMQLIKFYYQFVLMDGGTPTGQIFEGQVDN